MIKALFITFLKIYKLVLSPLLPKACRFFPSCSEYFIDAINKYGILRGFLLGLKRLIKCHPFGDYGFDPVENKENCSENESCGTKKYSKL